MAAPDGDADMLRQSEREEFKGDHLVAIETVGATVEALGRGEIELPPVPEKANKSHVFHAAPGGAAWRRRWPGFSRGRRATATKSASRRTPVGWRSRRPTSAPISSRRLPSSPEDDRSRQATSTVLHAVRSARTAATRPKKSRLEVEAGAFERPTKPGRPAATPSTSRVTPHDAARRRSAPHPVPPAPRARAKPDRGRGRRGSDCTSRSRATGVPGVGDGGGAVRIAGRMRTRMGAGRRGRRGRPPGTGT